MPACLVRAMSSKSNLETSVHLLTYAWEQASYLAMELCQTAWSLLRWCLQRKAEMTKRVGVAKRRFSRIEGRSNSFMNDNTFVKDVLRQDYANWTPDVCAKVRTLACELHGSGTDHGYVCSAVAVMMSGSSHRGAGYRRCWVYGGRSCRDHCQQQTK